MKQNFMEGKIDKVNCRVDVKWLQKDREKMKKI